MIINSWIRIFMHLFLWIFPFIIGIGYNNADDLLIRQMTAGSMQFEPSIHLIFSTPVLGYILKNLYAFNGNIEWYFLVTWLLLSICGSLWIELFRKKLSNSSFIGFYFLVLWSLPIYSLHFLSFTKTAIFLAITAFLIAQGELKMKGYLTILFIFLSLIFRINAVIWIVFILFIIHLLLFYLKVKVNFKLFIPIVLTITIFFTWHYWYVNNLDQNTKDLYHSHETRVQIFDYRCIEKSSNKNEILNKIGWSTFDLDFQYYYLPPIDKYSESNLEKAVLLSKESVRRGFFEKVLEDYKRRNPLHDIFIIGSVIIILINIYSRKNSFIGNLFLMALVIIYSFNTALTVLLKGLPEYILTPTILGSFALLLFKEPAYVSRESKWSGLYKIIYLFIFISIFLNWRNFIQFLKVDYHRMTVDYFEKNTKKMVMISNLNQGTPFPFVASHHLYAQKHNDHLFMLHAFSNNKSVSKNAVDLIWKMYEDSAMSLVTHKSVRASTAYFAKEIIPLYLMNQYHLKVGIQEKQSGNYVFFSIVKN